MRCLCIRVSKKNMTNKTKIIEINKSLCIRLYTNTNSFGPSLLRPPFVGRCFFLPQQNLFLISFDIASHANDSQCCVHDAGSKQRPVGQKYAENFCIVYSHCLHIQGLAISWLPRKKGQYFCVYLL